MGWETVLGTRPALRVLLVGDHADGLVPFADAGPDDVLPTRVVDLASALTILARTRFDCVLLELAGGDPSGNSSGDLSGDLSGDHGDDCAGAVRVLRERAGTAAVVVVCEQVPDGAGRLEDLADLVLGRDELAGAGVGALRQAAEHARVVWRLVDDDRPAAGPDHDLGFGFVVPGARTAPDEALEPAPDDRPGPAGGSAGPDEVLRGAEAMFTLGDDGRVTSWTGGAAQLYGYTASEVVGRDAAVLHPLSSTDVGPSLTGGREAGEVRGHDTVCRTRDGRLLPITLDAAPQVDGHGTPVGWVVVARTAVPS